MVFAAKDATGTAVVQHADGEAPEGGDLPRLVRIDTASLANGNS